MSRITKGLAAVLLLLAVLGVVGCQPSITSQLEAGIPEAAPRPTSMPNEVGKDAETVATELMDSKVNVRVAVPERTVPASQTANGGRILAVYVKPLAVDLLESDRRFLGFKVISQEPAPGVALAASQTVVLTVGAHPKAIAGATWYSTHMLDNKRLGNDGCLNSGAGESGCHTQSYCVSCHSSAIKQGKAPKL